MTEPRPTYTAGDNGNGGCECDTYAARLLAACQRELRALRADGNSPLVANFLLGQIHAYRNIIDGPLQQRVIVPLVRPADGEMYAVGATCSPDARHT